MKKEIVIVSAVRTPIGSFNGALAPVQASDLGACVISAAIKRSGVTVDSVGEVIMGQVLQAGCGQGPARQAAVKAGIPVDKPAYGVNIICGSGLKSVMLACDGITSGNASIVVAGGMESMSNSPYVLESARRGYRMGDGKLIDSMVHDALTDAFNNYHMGITAENVADKYSISMQEQNEFAYNSQTKALKAIEDGIFKDEIEPVVIKNRKGDIIFDTDEYPRKGITLDSLSSLRPAFKQGGSVTAGNSSGINDGAAALVLMDADKARELGLKPLARVVSYSAAGVDPAYMGVGPVPATRKALEKAGMKISDLDIIEANEAFAVQALAVGKELGWDNSKVNPYGGAIALGHPVGASGARILTTLTHSLLRNKKKYGLATLCVGGGMGLAMIIESVSDK